MWQTRLCKLEAWLVFANSFEMTRMRCRYICAQNTPRHVQDVSKIQIFIGKWAVKWDTWVWCLQMWDLHHLCTRKSPTCRHGFRINGGIPKHGTSNWKPVGTWDAVGHVSTFHLYLAKCLFDQVDLRISGLITKTSCGAEIVLAGDITGFSGHFLVFVGEEVTVTQFLLAKPLLV